MKNLIKSIFGKKNNKEIELVQTSHPVNQNKQLVKHEVRRKRNPPIIVSISNSNGTLRMEI